MVRLHRAGLVGALAAVLAVTGLTLVPTAGATPEGKGDQGQQQQDGSLRSLAARVGLRIGTAVNTDALASEPTYANIVATQFSTVTPENVMKWETVEPRQGQFDWAAADRLVSFAQQNGQLVRGHPLVWHNQLPSWLTGGSFTKQQLQDLLRQHVMTEASRYKGRIWQWDVVNEALNDDGTFRRTIWYDAFDGPGYIAAAFRWAREADPTALLFYNDYNLFFPGPKADAALALVTRLRAEGVPIDGIGFQGHIGLQYGYPRPGAVTANMKRFTDAGVDLAVTEADVRMPLPVTTDKQLAQAGVYTSLLQSCLALRRCRSFTVWGFTDKYSWVPGWFAGQGSATIYDETYQPKQAYFQMQQALQLAPGAPRRPYGGRG